ncbi:phosphate propanoyltransferase [Microgenomates group bacterium]|nr:phosphate propanoyltransferase [Microgenomates group bacterium]
MKPFLVKLSISGRHLHISREDLDALFGPNYQLTKFQDISQHGQWTAHEKVTLLGPKGQLDNVRILGPVRPQTQVEVSRTDATKLGVNPPVRESGDLSGTVGLTLLSPAGKKVELREGVMIAARHIHFSPEQAREHSLTDGDQLSVQINGQRGGVLHHVIVRVRSDYDEDLHVDTDEANALGIKNDSQGIVIGKSSL